MQRDAAGLPANGLKSRADRIARALLSRITLLIVGFGTAAGWVGPSFYEGVRRFAELLPFFRFCQPIFHFFLGKRRARTAHEFKRRKLFMRIHENSPR